MCQRLIAEISWRPFEHVDLFVDREPLSSPERELLIGIDHGLGLSAAVVDVGFAVECPSSFD